MASNSTLGTHEKNIPVMIMLSAFVPIGIAGNVLILYVYGKRFKVSTTRVFIIALAVFDLVSCVCLPYKILLLRFGELYNNIHLARLEMVRIYFLQVSLMILPLVSIDRYRRICQRQKKQISPLLAKILVAVLCILMATMTSFRMIVSRDSEGKYRAEAFISNKYLNQNFQMTIWNYVYFGYMGLPFFVPLPVMAIMYSLIGLKIQKLSRRMKILRRQIYPSSGDNSSNNTMNETIHGKPKSSMNYSRQSISQQDLEDDLPGDDVITSAKEGRDHVALEADGPGTDVSGRPAPSVSATKDEQSSSFRRYVSRVRLGGSARYWKSNGSTKRENVRIQDILYPVSDLNYVEMFPSDRADPEEEITVCPKRAFSLKDNSTMSHKKEILNIAPSCPSLVTEASGIASIDEDFDRNELKASTSLRKIKDRSPPIITQTADISSQRESECVQISQRETVDFHTDTKDLRVSAEVQRGNPSADGRHISSSSGPNLPWKRMTFIFFMITVVYIIACLPFLVLFIIFRVSEDYGRKLLSNGIVIMLYNFPYITNISNCFLYGFFDPRFRRELTSLRRTVTCSASWSLKTRSTTGGTETL